MKTLFTIIFAGLTLASLAQNVDFKAANFKDDKDGLKKATDAIKTGEGFFSTANNAIFSVQNPGNNYKKALAQFEIAQKFNPNNALNNLRIGIRHFYSTDPKNGIRDRKSTRLNSSNVKISYADFCLKQQ